MKFNSAVKYFLYHFTCSLQ